MARRRIQHYASGNTPPAARLLSDVTVPFDGLEASKAQIVANGTDAALVHYATALAGASHAWTINGVPVSEPATRDAASGLYCSEVEIDTLIPGQIVVSVGGESLTLTATVP